MFDKKLSLHINPLQNMVKYIWSYMIHMELIENDEIWGGLWKKDINIFIPFMVLI